MNNNIDMKNNKKSFSSVFIFSSVIVAIFVLLGAFFPVKFNSIGNNITSWITETLGWYYMIVVISMILFCIFLILSPIGKLKLGKPNDKPEFNTVSWFAMLFSAGMGIGLVFWGAAEPISHFASPPTADPKTTEAYAESLQSAFFDWGFHAWGVYGAVALALAYFQFRKDEAGLVSRTLRPIFGNKVDGPLGNVIDILSVIATLGGVTVSLGMGALQINGGLSYLFGIPNNIFIQSIIIVIVTILFLMSAWSGLNKGIQLLSNVNLGIAGFLLIAVMIIGPSILILNAFTTSTGNFLTTFLHNSFDTGMFNSQKKEWMSQWTFFQLAWWISWSPFVGVFIARVSKGRTVREFIGGVMLVPVILSFLWFSVFGVLGIETAKKHPAIFDLPPETTLFAVYNEIPFGLILSIITLALIATFFITSADSATFVLGMLTTHGSLNPSGLVKIIWGVAQAAIAFILLFTGGDNGLNALQNIAIITALPFSIIIIFMMISFYKDANRERKFLGLTLTPKRTRANNKVANMSDDELINLIKEERRK
ncbi:BCCT family transporter [Mammaliicoccus sciuri]|uniref:BCCT family transporter n=3 Tax=Mammaliicoccus sciuri TaxID=1296 RepID=UPI000D1FA805|nr:BCCT family transporter [Mammaliicoccus sciuri]PTJ50122.1 choline transporter [Mammaliicoccus sciuri]RIO10889.1 BCCT family transporter [Mammaliicoccus sciuri]